MIGIISGCQDQSPKVTTLETSNIIHTGRDDPSIMCRGKPETDNDPGDVAQHRMDKVDRMVVAR